ncbi:hypothetical protein BDP55DRAFT_319099 [Colletotrichum godetiae]|uniref:Secreted protein n=1 Tax=Colletotrichum godetiae TaxID=1209918 RepID=A0AAJ0EQ13_9PEZI|nr:uncharacterized protein BDP55DRAFT_319099 [Colletotrichum godetiae]KAK1671092.1 hypothetical protein BDP55DRAFT_319099 [Colletotrichum godetiae]
MRCRKAFVVSLILNFSQTSHNCSCRTWPMKLRGIFSPRYFPTHHCLTRTADTWYGCGVGAEAQKPRLPRLILELRSGPRQSRISVLFNAHHDSRRRNMISQRVASLGEPEIVTQAHVLRDGIRAQ